MTPFEEELKNALQRSEPPPGFKSRLLERVAAQQSEQPALRTFWLRFASVVALLLLVISSFSYRRHLQDQKGEAAKQQLLVALRIASGELRTVELRVRHASTDTGMVTQ